MSRKINGFGNNVVQKIKYALNRIIRKGKDRVDKKEQVNVVQKVNFNNCDDASYVGESKSSIGVRIPEHHWDGKKVNKETPFFKHMITTDHHTFDFDGSLILDIEPNYY